MLADLEARGAAPLEDRTLREIGDEEGVFVRPSSETRVGLGLAKDQRPKTNDLSNVVSATEKNESVGAQLDSVS